MMLARIALAACFALAYLPGCAEDAGKPLTSAGIDQALTRPQLQAMRVQVASLHHPALRAVEIGPEDGLTPNEAALVAVLANPALRAARDQRGISQGQLLQAGLLPNPSLDWANEVPYQGPDHFIAYGLGVKWELSALISHKAKVQAASAAAASVDLDIAWQEWQTAQSARTAVYRRAGLEAQLALAQDVDERLSANAQTIRHAVQEQQKTRIDLAAAETASQEAHTIRLELQRDLAKQKQALNRLLGLPGEATVILRKGIVLPAQLDVPAGEELQKGLEDRRLDLLALRRGYDSQQATVRAAILSRFPKLEGGGGTARDTAGSYTVGYDLAMDIPIFDRNQGQIAIEKATRQKLYDEFVNRVFEGRSDIASAEEEIHSLQEQIAFAQASLPALQRLVESYEEALAGGHVDILSYYGARNDLAKKRIDIFKLKAELVDAWINLENASGQMLWNAAPPVTTAPVTTAPSGQ